MKKLVFAALLAAGASQAVGCVVTEADPVITADIQIHNGGPAATIDCIAGDGVRVNARLTGTSSGFSDVFNCDVVALQTPPLTSGFGLYDVWVDYINDRGFPNDPSQWVVVDTTDYQTVDVQGDLHVIADLTLNNGFFSANWSITTQGGSPVTMCAPNSDVSILATIAGTSQATEDLFNCEDGFNNPNPVFTDPLALDDYVLSVDLLDSGGNPITVAASTANATITNGNEYVDLLIDLIVP